MHRTPLFPLILVLVTALSGGWDPSRADTGTSASSAPTFVALGTDSAVVDLETLYREAAGRHPGLRAQYERWQSSLAHVAATGGWPDPQISYTYYLQSVETALGPQEHAVALNQMIPWFGKIGARKSAAAEAARAAEQRFRSTQLELYESVAHAWYEWAYLSRAVEITRENLDLLRQAETVLRSRYRANEARYADLLRLQVAEGKLDDRLQSLLDRRTPRRTALNESLGRPLDAELPWPVALGPAAADAPADSLVLELVGEQHPRLVELEHQIAQSGRMLDLTRKQGYPDFRVGVKGILTGESDLTNFPDAGRDAWMATVSINLPLWRGKISGGIEREEATQLARRHQLTDARRKLLTRTQDVLYRRRDARRTEDLYAEDLVPRARQALQATLADYTSGQASFLDFIDSQRELLEFELALARARADRFRADASLVSLANAAPNASPQEDSE